MGVNPHSLGTSNSDIPGFEGQRVLQFATNQACNADNAWQDQGVK
jgi:hypothetical protein